MNVKFSKAHDVELPELSRWEIVGHRDKPPVREIIAACAQAFGITNELILSPRRQAELISPRHAAMYLAVRLRPDLSLPAIARMFNRADHTTIIYGFRKAAAMRSVNMDYADIVDAIERLLTAQKGGAA